MFDFLFKSLKTSFAEIFKIKLQKYFQVEHFHYDEEQWEEETKLGVETFDIQIWKKTRIQMFEKVEKLLENKSQKKIEKSLIILIDDNMYYKSMRKTFFKLALKCFFFFFSFKNLIFFCVNKRENWFLANLF